jgi:hypothetical protein
MPLLEYFGQGHSTSPETPGITFIGLDQGMNGHEYSMATTRYKRVASESLDESDNDACQ